MKHSHARVSCVKTLNRKSPAKACKKCTAVLLLYVLIYWLQEFSATLRASGGFAEIYVYLMAEKHTAPRKICKEIEIQRRFAPRESLKCAIRM